MLKLSETGREAHEMTGSETMLFGADNAQDWTNC